jgi:hypothetical protein
MSTEMSQPTIAAPLRSAVGCIACIIAISLMGFLLVCTFFYTPYWNGYIMLPGVIVAAVSAIICMVVFFRCPSRHAWAKMLALASLVPSLWFAVYCGLGLIYPGFL